MEKIEEVTMQLEIAPIEKSPKAWYLNGYNNGKLWDAEITNPAFTFAELVARALKTEEVKTAMMDSSSKTEQVSTNGEE